MLLCLQHPQPAEPVTARGCKSQGSMNIVLQVQTSHKQCRQLLARQRCGKDAAVEADAMQHQLLQLLDAAPAAAQDSCRSSGVASCHPSVCWDNERPCTAAAAVAVAGAGCCAAVDANPVTRAVTMAA